MAPLAAAGRRAEPHSPQAWVDALCRALLEPVPAIVEARLAPWRPRALILGGSAALGEALGGIVAREDGGELRALLSDLDLWAVTERAAPPEARADLDAALRAAATETLARHGAVAVTPGPVTLGLLPSAALERQRPTLGLVDLVDRGRTLWGDPSLRKRIRAPRPAEIPPYEAWRLVGNRSRELLLAEAAAEGPAETAGAAPAETTGAGPAETTGAGPAGTTGAGPAGTAGAAPAEAAAAGPARTGGGRPGTATLAVLHARAKFATGLWTARLVLSNRYEVGWAARRRRLAEAESGGAGTSDMVVRCASTFAPFLEAPERAGLPPEGEQRRLLRDALRAWLQQAAGAGDLAPGRESGDLPEAVLLAEPISWRERYRAWKMERGRRGPWRGASRAACLRRAAVASEGTPAARRLAAAVLYVRLAPADRHGGWAREEAAAWRRDGARLLGSAPEPGPESGRQLAELLAEA